MRPVVKHLGQVDYESCQMQMRAFTLSRDADTEDELWVVSHAPVYTQGTSCSDTPFSTHSSIPVVKSDRGGQITYHGPGQIILYLLVDLKRHGLGPKRYVQLIEQAIIDVLATYSVQAARKANAPGVYVDAAKIGALGLRVRNGRSYHGLSLNVSMDLMPFKGINPCGYEGLEVCELKDFIQDVDQTTVTEQLIQRLNCLISV